MLPITRLNNCQVIVKAIALDTDSTRLVTSKHNLELLMSGLAWPNKTTRACWLALYLPNQLNRERILLDNTPNLAFLSLVF